MALVVGTLTALKVAALVKKGRAGKYHDGGNLILRITPSSTANWVFRYSRGGKERSLGLGKYPAVTLQAAREKAAQYRTMIANGEDPTAARVAKVTFKECGEAYVKTYSPTWRNAVHRNQWTSTLKAYVYPVFGDKPVDHVTTEDVVSALTPIHTVKVETATRLRGRIERILDWAKTKGYRHGDNPARWRGHLEHVLPKVDKKVKHHRALPYQELPQLMKSILLMEGVASEAWAFTILTCARTGDVIGASWDEVNFETKMWIAYDKRTKTKVDYRIPLSEEAIAILRRQYQGDTPPTAGCVFRKADGNGLSNGAMLALRNRMGYRHLTTVHGLRATFSTWGQECTDHPDDLFERSLNHKVGTAVERAYARSDKFQKRLSLANEWATYVMQDVDKG